MNSALNTTPASPRCKTILESRQHAVIGVSPFNGYFTEDRIFELAQWADHNFNDFHLFLPDEPSQYTLQALGYSKKKAAHKARRQANYLKNKTARALKRIGLSGKAADEKIIDSEKLKQNKVYTSCLSEYKEMFENDTLFRNGCMATSEWVLGNKIQDKDSLEPEIITLATNYFLAEVPLFFHSPEIFRKRSSVFCYHKIPELLKMMYNHRYLNIIDPNQGFVILSIQNHNSKTLK